MLYAEDGSCGVLSPIVVNPLVNEVMPDLLVSVYVVLSTIL